MWGNASGVMTAFGLLAFVGVVWWSYSSRQNRRFDEAAQLALDPEDREIPFDEMEQRS